MSWKLWRRNRPTVRRGLGAALVLIATTAAVRRSYAFAGEPTPTDEERSEQRQQKVEESVEKFRGAQRRQSSINARLRGLSDAVGVPTPTAKPTPTTRARRVEQ